MKWKIFYAENAQRDLNSIYEYIAFSLLEPETAAKQVQRLTEAVRSLEQLPMRHPVYDDEPWRSLSLRSMTVGKYLVFYLPQEENRTVIIVRIVYGGRNLKETEL